MKFIPAILSDQPGEIKDQLQRLENLPELSRVQFDIIDGIFADNLTVTPADLNQFDLSDFQVDLHLMTEEPIDFVHELIDHRQHLPINAVIAQVEHMSSQAHFLEEVKVQGWKPGLALDAYSFIEAVDDESWELLEIIQVMGVKAGFQGQGLIDSSLDLIKEIKKYLTVHNLEIEIILDGGVKLQNIDLIAPVGVDSVVVGSDLWLSASIEEQLKKYQQKLESLGYE